MLGLATLLPGIRELRTPMATGILWLVWIVTMVVPQVESLLAQERFALLYNLAQSLPRLSLYMGLGLLAYIVGILSVALMESLPQSGSAQVLQGKMEGSSSSLVQRVGLRLVRPSPVTNDLINNAVRERLFNVSRLMADVLPTSIVVREFHLAALRLAKESPEQYQEYDRIAAEARFRINISIPLLALSLTMASALPTLLLVPVAGAAVVVCAVLLFLGIENHHKADELLASVIYFGYTSTPILDVLTQSAKDELPPDRSDPDPYDLAWLGDFLCERHMSDIYMTVLSRLRHPSRNRIDVIQRALPLMRERTREQIGDPINAMIKSRG